MRSDDAATPTPGLCARAHLAPAFVAVATALAYSNAIRGGFVFDDLTLIVNNPTIRSIRFVPRILTTNLWAFMGWSSNYYRPVPPLFLLLVHSAFGLRPEMFHALALVLHAASAAAVFGIVRAMLRDAGQREAIWPAVLAGLLFGLHPVNCESVAWNSGLVDVVGTFFSVVAIWAYVRAEGARSATRWRTLACGSLGGALFSKESALAIPAALVAYDVASGRIRADRARAVAVRWGPMVGVAGAYLVVRVLVLGGLAPDGKGGAGSIGEGPIVLSRYLEKLAVPVQLSVVHEIPRAVSLSSADGVRTALVLAAFIAIAVIAWRGPRPMRLGVLMVFLPILPVVYAQVRSGPQLLGNRFAERHLYLPTVGWAILVSTAARWIAQRSAPLGRAVVGGAAVLVGLFAVGTIARIPVWHDEAALWSDAVAKSPGVAEAHFNLGIALLEVGEDVVAERELQAGAHLDPAFPRQLFAMALDAERARDYRSALARLKVVTLALPRFADARFRRGEVLASLGDVVGALSEYVAALHLDSHHVDAARRAARLLAGQGRRADAIRVLETAARNVPDSEALRRDLEEARGAEPASRRR